MKIVFVMLSMMALASCASQRVRCEGSLRRINPPAPVKQEALAAPHIPGKSRS